MRPDVRKAVLKAATELGYIPNESARNLVMQRTGLVALAFANPDVLVGTTFFADLVSNIVARLDESRYRTVLLLPNEDRARTMSDVVYRGSFDGALVVGHHQGDPLLELLVASEIPTVTLGRPMEDIPVSSVDVDNVAAAAMATTHLLSQGRTRPALLSCSPGTSWGVDRLAGFRRVTSSDAAASAGEPIQECAFSAEGGYAGTMSLLERVPGTDAALVASATLLPGVLNALADSGRRVPDDVAVVTFDDEPNLEHTSPPVTAIRQPLARLGTEMASALVAMVSTPGLVTTTTLTADLVIRESSGGRMPDRIRPSAGRRG